MFKRRSRLSAIVGRKKKTKKTDHINHHEIASGCCGRRGCLLQGGVGFRNNERSRPAAPLSGGPSIRAGKSRHVPSARATSSIGRQGKLIPMTLARRSGLLRTAARPWRAVWTGRARSTVRLFRHRRYHSFTRGGWFELSSSSRTAGQRHRIWSRPSVACPRRKSGDSTRRASFAGPSCGLNPRTGSRGTFAVTGW